MKQYEEEFLDKFGYKGLKIIAAYEDTMDLDYSDHYASWFGSYNMHVFSARKEISFDQLRARYYKSLSLLGITTEQVDETCSHILTADLSTHIRNEKLRTVKTNVGEMPLEDYQEIRAAEIGYDSYAEMYAAGLRIGHGYDAMSVWERYKPFDFIRDTFTIGDDITLRAHTEIIQASLAFNAEEIFGIHATPGEIGQPKMYAEYDPEKDKVEVSFQLSGNAYSSYYFCELTEGDAQLVKEKLTETILERYDQTPQEFIKGDCDAGMTMGGI